MAARSNKPIWRFKPHPGRLHTAAWGAHALIWGNLTYPHRQRPLLLLHGLPQRPDVFEPLAGRLERLGLLPIAPYLYGHLYSRPQGPEGCHLACFLDNALAAANRLRLKSFDVVGIGLGAAVGWMLAGRYPRRVRWLASIQFPHPAAAGVTGQWQEVRGEERAPGTQGPLRKNGRLLRLRKQFVRELLIGQGLPRFHLDRYVERLSAPGVLEVAFAWNASQPPQELPQLQLPMLLVSNADGQPAGSGRAQTLVPSGLAQEAVLEETRFPLESASGELISVLEQHLPQR